MTEIFIVCELAHTNFQRENLVCLLCLERIVDNINILKRLLINNEKYLETHAGIASDKSTCHNFEDKNIYKSHKLLW